MKTIEMTNGDGHFFTVQLPKNSPPEVSQVLEMFRDKSFWEVNPVIELDTKWGHQMDRWAVRLGTEVFDFWTGTGHRFIQKSTYPRGKNPREFKMFFTKAEKKTIHPDKLRIGQYEALAVPSLASVLHSILWDARLGQESFDDFCWNMGYDNDSISAFDTYRECMGMYKRIRKVLDPEHIEKLETILEDY